MSYVGKLACAEWNFSAGAAAVRWLGLQTEFDKALKAFDDSTAMTEKEV
jgi:hypothetical protein